MCDWIRWGPKVSRGGVVSLWKALGGWCYELCAANRLQATMLLVLNTLSITISGPKHSVTSSSFTPLGPAT